MPSSLQLATDQWELLQDAKRASYSSSRVRGEAVGDDHTIEILNRLETQLDVCHALGLMRDYSASRGIVLPSATCFNPSWARS